MADRNVQVRLTADMRQFVRAVKRAQRQYVRWLRLKLWLRGLCR